MMSVLVGIVGVFALQTVSAATVSTGSAVASASAASAISSSLYDGSAFYHSIMAHAPYFSYCDLPWSSYFDESLSAKFNALAVQYNLRISDIYNWHGLLIAHLPNLPFDSEYALLSLLAAEYQREMIRRGISYLPHLPSCYPHNMLYPANPVNIYKRQAPVMPVDLTMPYRNLYTMLDRIIPNLSSLARNNIRNHIYAYIPADMLNVADMLTYQLLTSMRFGLGTSSPYLPSLLD